jgi:hypothetical protein
MIFHYILITEDIIFLHSLAVKFNRAPYAGIPEVPYKVLVNNLREFKDTGTGGKSKRGLQIRFFPPFFAIDPYGP